ncbi:GNAT family N-acetyltransferase [Leptonema illini]|uniref:Acetyltransferase, GNAT family n=1 Tax=Leptonema illini DSM 21528 TaxID=929563 RepID=H2CG47_9LEPT|nr:GNAT family N-acetyltransferase [Leptonema illini]EHQ05728.1 Acetyltransferase, GNAT family [Leptonema illini DSM 21528]
MIQIIDYSPTMAHQIADLFHASIHRVACRDYTAEELAVWAPFPIDYDHWLERLNRKQPAVAVDSNETTVLGFAELDPDGHIDCFYVHPDHQRRGVGIALMQAIAEKAEEIGLRRLFAEVSITAKPFFLQMGFTVVRPNLAARGGMLLKNYIMERFCQ